MINTERCLTFFFRLSAENKVHVEFFGDQGSTSWINKKSSLLKYNGLAEYETRREAILNSSNVSRFFLFLDQIDNKKFNEIIYLFFPIVYKIRNKKVKTNIFASSSKE